MSVTLKKNDIITLCAESIMQNGNAVAHTPDGFVVFILSACAGDTVSAKVIKVTKNYAVAKIEKILQPSPDRNEDGCPFAIKCGGCVFQHINYEKESEFKKNSVNDAFLRIAKLPLRLENYYQAKNTKFYRNKAVYPIAPDKDGKAVSGFYARMSHRIVPHDECFIGNPIFVKIRDGVTSFMNQNKISAYDEISGKGIVRSVHMRCNSACDSVSLTLILNGDILISESTEKKFCAVMTSDFPEIKTILININKGNTNAVLGEKWRTIFGDGCIYDTLCGRSFRITPASFWQVNHEQTEILYGIAKQYAALSPDEKLLDLYCGTGTVGLCVAEKDTRLFGVEIVPQAVVDANFNADLNGINAEFMCFDAASALDTPELLALKPDVITLDPPRKGCVGAVEKIAELGAKRIVYISCDPATLARDLARFDELGYKAQKACSVDMFPRTGHVESVVLMSRVQK